MASEITTDLVISLVFAIFCLSLQIWSLIIQRPNIVVLYCIYNHGYFVGSEKDEKYAKKG